MKAPAERSVNPSMVLSAERLQVYIGGRILQVSHLDRVLWPRQGWRKADLMEYLVEVAPLLLPHLRNRPLTVVRYPDGVEGQGFYQKRCPSHAPSWIRTHRAPSGEAGHGAGAKESIEYILADEVATLIWLANHNAIELHPWLATADRPDYPLATVIDIDPMPPTGFTEARRTAFRIKELLDSLGLQGFPKLSGATGIHIYIPLDGKTTFRRSRAFAQWVADFLATHFPKEITNVRAVRRRGPRVYIDPLQNLPHKTIVAPYSPRALPVGSVSAPVTWEELADATPDEFTLKSMPRRLKQVGDLFQPVLQLRQTLPDPARLPVRL